MFSLVTGQNPEQCGDKQKHVQIHFATPRTPGENGRLRPFSGRTAFHAFARCSDNALVRLRRKIRPTANACRNRSKVIALTLSRAGREPPGKQVKSQLIAVIVYNYLY